MARQGKIARLPHALRDEVNRRLLNGETARELLGWLNAQPSAIETWATHFEDAPANPQNLSEWRLGGYKDWLKKRERVENLKTLSAYASELAKAGGSVSDGAAAIAAGHILEALENAATTEDADLGKLTLAVTRLKKADLAKAKLALDKRKHTTKEAEVKLSREKFELQTAEQFLTWVKNEDAQAILNNGKTKSIQISELRQLMFGERK